MNASTLCQAAVNAMNDSYSPYSGFKVGAALLCRNGEVFSGANIENAAYTPTVCAERAAFFRAVNNGKRDFVAIAVAGGKNGVITGACPPCGVCRQVMAEFCGPDFKILVVNGDDTYNKYTLGELLPEAFGPKNI